MVSEDICIDTERMML